MYNLYEIENKCLYVYIYSICIVILRYNIVIVVSWELLLSLAYETFHFIINTWHHFRLLFSSRKTIYIFIDPFVSLTFIN